MRVKTVLYVFIFIITPNLSIAKPDFARLAEVFGAEIDPRYEESIVGYVDHQRKLWVVGRKWHTEKVVVGGGGGAVILPDGRVVQSPPPQYAEMPTFPYLYLWLYDGNGDKIKEGPLGDSIKFMKMLPIKEGILLLYTYAEQPHERPIHYGAIVLDKNGAVVVDEKIADENQWPWQVTQRQEKIRVISTRCGRTYLVEASDRGITTAAGPEFKCYLTPDKRTFEILEVLDSVNLFGWTRVDTATEFTYDSRGQASWDDYVLLKDKIQTAMHNQSSESWDVRRYTVSEAYFRKYEGFDLFSLPSSPSVEEYPEVQSIKSEDESIIVTVFLNENSQPVAYQMLFDSLGTLVPFEKVERRTPRGIDDIPDECDIFIKREAGRWKNSKVWIWGYDKEEGQLYWKKYTIAID